MTKKKPAKQIVVRKRTSYYPEKKAEAKFYLRPKDPRKPHVPLVGKEGVKILARKAAKKRARYN